jgi:apolipoprotein N-acyltransferase
VDVDVNSVSTVRESVIAQSKALKTPILIGGVTKSTKGPQNQSILFNPDIKQVYTKRYLTPFGEYLPMRSVASRFSQYANQVDDFVGGESDTVFEIGKVTFQSLICYEILDDALRDKIQSDFLVVQTNNATFGDTAQLDQELNIARVRAAESGRYIPYVSTTGVTTLIDNRGNIIKDLPKFESATLFGEIEKVNGSTFTQVFGKYLEAIAIIWLLVILALRRRGSR